MREWKEYSLGELTIWRSGGTPSKKNPEYWDGDIPWISASSMTGTRYSDSSSYITELGLENGSRLARKNDILLLVRGSGLFNEISVGIATKEIAFNQDVKAISVKKEIINPWYLLFWFIGNRKKLSHLLEETGIGAGKFDIETLKNLIVTVPEPREQDEILKLAKGIDDKIILLHHQNQTLEKIAQTLFKHWFIDFEFPNEEGKPYRSSGGKMVASEWGEVPEGWKEGLLSEIIINVDRMRIPLSSSERESRKGSFPYYGAASVLDYVDDYLFDGTYVLLGEDGTVIDNFGYPILQYVFGKFWVNNHAHVLQGKKPFSTNYIYLFLRKTKVSNIVTGAVQPKINQANLNSIETLIPSKIILTKFDAIISSTFEKIKLNHKEITSLTKTRDTLLPKLMSGQIRIQEAEKQIP
ncbi:MAG: hypothetical protein KIPDCIKN_03813 [Haliscomenobacter sp.]|jgi:type I restriction enzyme S subunit|nr:hypothetical protein [Haliscomenobacter sp.]